jgi:hypothetical protein
MSVSAYPSGYPSSWDGVEVEKSKRWPRERAQAYARYIEMRDAIRRDLGGKCVACGAAEDLAFDHPRGRTWAPEQKNRLQRMRLYRRDLLAGNLRLLCRVCNGHDGWVRSRMKEMKGMKT